MDPRSSSRCRPRAARTVTSVLTGGLLAVGSLFSSAAPAAAATSATFSPTAGLLSVIGDNLDNAITVSRAVNGALLVNGGAIPVAGGLPTVANTTRIQVFGQGGNDTLALSENLGALPATTLFGGSGADTLTAGSSGDQLFGQAGNDVLNGRGGTDLLFGGADADALLGGDGDDQLFGEAGDDRMVWNPGDDTDQQSGGDGVDGAEVNGGAGAEVFTATANGVRVRVDRVNPAPFALDLGSTERLTLNAGGGDDVFSTVGSLAALLDVTVDAGAGQDLVLGSDGDDVLLGGEGDDVVDGQRGQDAVFLGAGADAFQWDPGDGNDVVDGQADQDRLLFNGSSAGERLALSSNGSRLRLVRDVARVSLDLNDLEGLSINAGSGADDLTFGDLSDTDLTEVDTDLAAPGSRGPDGSPDTITIAGTGAADSLQVTGAGVLQQVTGLPTRFLVRRADPAPTDRVSLDTGSGRDLMDASQLAAPAAVLLDGGDDDDILVGSAGDDTLLGGAGNDVLIGGDGTDTLDGGPGDDVLVDGESVTDGQVATPPWLASHARTVDGHRVVEIGESTLRIPAALAGRAG